MYVLDEHKPLDMGLHPDEIHVWSASLDQPRSGVQRLSQTLSLGERKRAERFHFEKKWKDFVVSHGILRTIMGRYLNAEANKLQFCYGKYLNRLTWRKRNVKLVQGTRDSSSDSL